MHAKDANKMWGNPISGNIPLLKDIVVGGWTKVQSHALDIIRALLVDVRWATNRQRLQLMNYLKTRLRTTTTLHKRLHRFHLTTIRKVRYLKPFRHLSQQSEFRGQELEEVALMLLRRSMSRLMPQAIQDILIGLVSAFSKHSGTYALRMQE